MKPAFLDEMSWAMAEVYGAVTDRILVNLAHYFPYIKDSNEVTGSFDYQARMLAQMGQVNRETVDIIMKSLGGADDALRQALEAAIMEALKPEEPKLRQAAQKGLLNGSGFIPPEVSPGQMQAFKSYYKQSADKLNLVNTVMLESTQTAYTATVSDIASKIQRTQSILNIGTGEVISGVSAYNQAVRSSVQKMVQNGLTGFIDHGGHHWSPEAYVAMDIRTTMFNTSRAAIWERADDYGCDTYQVSSHNGARPLCYPWQGKVISRNDLVREVEDLDGTTVHVYAQSETTYGQAAGLFGVNCKHYPMTFIPGFSTLKGEPQDPEENAKEYEESQQQRALERKLREERRDLAVMKAQGAPEAEIKAQRERVKKASQDIDDFCDETGRARKKSREGTPINAKFPPEGSYDPKEFQTTERDKMQEFFNGKKQIATAKENQRPTNEQPVLSQFNRYDVSTKTQEQKLLQANPHYVDGGKEWKNNCQRTVVAEELIYRGYNVTAKAFDPKDAIGDSGIKCWKFSAEKWYNDPDLKFVSRTNFKKTIESEFKNWGDGSRAVIRLKWTRKYGGNGHFINAVRKEDSILYIDPQSGKVLDINEKLSHCTTGKNQMWFFRSDNRELTDLVSLAVENVGD